MIVSVAVAGARRDIGECEHLVLQGSYGREKVGYLFGCGYIGLGEVLHVRLVGEGDIA